MTSGRGIDHVVLAARDLGALAQRYETLGFRLTPLAFHEDRMGTSNRLAQFRGRNFIELLEVDRPQSVADPGPGGFAFGAFLKRFLAAHEGLAMIVFATDDARADIARWREAGLDTYAPFDFERQARLPDSSEVTVGFSLGFVTSPELPDLAFFVCENRAPEHFWKPAFQEHPNGAEALTAVTIAAHEPGRHAGFLGRLFGGAVTEIAGGVSVACGAHRIEVVAPGALGALGVGADTDGRAVGLTLRASGPVRPAVAAADAGHAFLAWEG